MQTLIEIVVIVAGSAIATVVVWAILSLFVARQSLFFGEDPQEVVRSSWFLWPGRILFASGIILGWLLAIGGWRNGELSPFGSIFLAVVAVVWGALGLRWMQK